MFLLIELCFTALSIAIACAFPNLGANWFERCEQMFGRLAHRRGLAILVVGLAALAVRAAVLPILPIPEPAIQDEFSYLLASDTFAHGRVTNPPHPMWVHFETFHVIQQPSYASMYPPAQGLMLALGQVVLGHPFWGVWLSLGLMSASICWMLQAWLPETWALLGGFIAVMRLAAFSYWGNSYWGGAVAATGGALLLGALPRVKQSPRAGDAVLMGLGLAILANSRPYEGLIFSLPVMAALLVWMLGKDLSDLRLVVKRVVAPLLLVLLLTVSGMGYYFWRVTGNAFRMPYQVDRDTYAVAPYFMWQGLRPQPPYHHEVMRTFYTQWEPGAFTAIRSLQGLIAASLEKMDVLWLFYLGPLFLLTVLSAAAIAPYGLSWNQINPNTRFLLMAAGTSMVGFMGEVYFSAHYAAPMAGLIIALLLLAMRYLRRWQRHGRPTGLAIVRGVTSVCVVLLLVRGFAGPLHLPVRPVLALTWSALPDQILDRTRILSQLQESSGQHLVLVRYTRAHNYHAEWVYNLHDIDSSKVVWARDMGGSQNEELIKYFENRKIWLVEPDETPARLSEYRRDMGH